MKHEYRLYYTQQNLGTFNPDNFVRIESQREAMKTLKKNNIQIPGTNQRITSYKGIVIHVAMIVDPENDFKMIAYYDAYLNDTRDIKMELPEIFKSDQVDNIMALSSKQYELFVTHGDKLQEKNYTLFKIPFWIEASPVKILYNKDINDREIIQYQRIIRDNQLPVININTKPSENPGDIQ